MPDTPRSRWTSTRWKRGLVVILVGVLLPALLPVGQHYSPGPYFDRAKQSASLPLMPGNTPLKGDLILRRARIVDVNGVRGPTSIRIEAGVITAIADDVGAGPIELDVDGATVMPGLIDAHVHLSLTPGGLTREDDAETTRSLRLHHMRAYLASGITTIFDPAVENVLMEDIQRSLQAGHAGPRYLAVGTPMGTPGGYLESLFPPGIRRAEEVGPQLDANQKAGAVGTKMTFEPGFAGPIWRLHPREVEAAIVEETTKRHLPLYVHAERAEMVRRALAVHPHALVHGPIDGTVALAAEIAAAKIPVITTLALFDAHAVMLHPEQMDAPHIQRVVPAKVLESIRDRRQYRFHAFGLLSEVTPYVPGLYRDLLAWMLTTDIGLKVSDDGTRDMGRSAMQSIRYLRDAGVPLVMGSDSGNWPLFPYYFHGPTSWRELRLLAEAGLTPQEVLRAATVAPAQMLGMEDSLGTVDIGKAADLLIVRADPLEDVEKALHTLEVTIRGGVAKSPDEWMVAP